MRRALLVGLLLLAGCDVGAPTVPQLAPLPGAKLTASFGPRARDPVSGRAVVGLHHDGYDLAARMGAPIRASRTGQVTFAGMAGGYGKLVVLRHPGGWETRYGHASRLAVKVGAQVRAGQVIAFVGSTGHSTGPHLHYELRLRGVAVDPQLPARRAARKAPRSS